MDETSLFIDYSWNDTHLDLTPRHKLNLTLTLEEEKEWRGGIEAFYTGSQYVFPDKLTRDYWVFGVMVEKLFPIFSITANIENLFNIRQSKWETMVNPPLDNPVFSPIWGPTEGLSANIALQVHL
jgi:iron complex outermembrane receptor protein